MQGKEATSDAGQGSDPRDAGQGSEGEASFLILNF